MKLQSDHPCCTHRVCSLLLSALMLLSSICPAHAASEEYGLATLVQSSLTEVLGYMPEEAAQFVVEEENEHLIRFWPPEHPGWVYTLSLGQRNQVTSSSPFDTGYSAFPGENTVRSLLRTVLEEGWLSDWNPDNRQKLLAHFKEEHHYTPGSETYLSEHAGNALHGLFESFYGPETGWTEPLHEWFRSLLDAYDLPIQPLPFHTPGIQQVTFPDPHSVAVHTLTLFEQDVPPELITAFEEPRLVGWTCQAGAILASDWSRASSPSMSRLNEGVGLAGLQKDGQRMLVMLENENGTWNIYPVGENALLANEDYRIRYDFMRSFFTMEYLRADGSTLILYVSPVHGDHYCKLLACENRVPEPGHSLWLDASGRLFPTWKDEPSEETAVYHSRLPSVLGFFPTEMLIQSARATDEGLLPVVPDGFTIAGGVNLRASASSHSKSLGLLMPGTVIPILETLPGSNSPWIHTRIGFLEGYVSSDYTQESNASIGLNDPPLLAKSVKALNLKKGTGWFAGKAGSCPVGTKMRVIMESGNWLYVCVPDAGLSSLMNTDGMYGYIRKEDVILAYMEGVLDWLN